MSQAKENRSRCDFQVHVKLCGARLPGDDESYLEKNVLRVVRVVASRLLSCRRGRWLDSNRRLNGESS